MKRAKLMELRVKDIVISSGQEVYRQENIRAPIIPILNTDMSAIDHAAVLSETIDLPIVRMVTCHQGSGFDEGDFSDIQTEESYFVLSDELRKSLEIVRLEEKERHKLKYLKVCSKLEDAHTVNDALEHKCEQVVCASLWKRIKYMFTGNAGKLLD